MLNEIIILPYRSKLNHKEYLIRKETIEKWDDHPDLCSISFPYPDNNPLENILPFVKEKINQLLKIDSKESDIFNLGICQESKYSSKTYYLYCININKYKYLYNDKSYEFVKEDNLIKSIDSQLITTYSRLQFLHLK